MSDWNNSSGWDTGAGGGGDSTWQPDLAGSTNGDGFGASFASAGGDGTGNDNNGGEDRSCFNCGELGHNRADCPKPVTCKGCGQEGHMRKECPERPAQDGPFKCFRCGEEGHGSKDCPMPIVCKECGSEDHLIKDCPNRVCKNCGEKGHTISQCESARKVDRSMFPDTTTEAAWNMIHAAVKEREIDELKFAVQTYLKASPEATYVELETAFRSQEVGAYLIAMEKPNMVTTLTNMDLQGNLDKKYAVLYRFSNRPMRPYERATWPASAEENLERLANAGEPVPRGLPKCQNCDQIGHISKSCPEDKKEVAVVKTIKCYHCDEEGHRIRDCPKPRVSKFACKNCGEEGHKAAECEKEPNMDNVDCRKCGETGHFARDCPQGGGRACRNCGQEGHMAKECTEPRNMALVQCRNCDEMGHQARDCPKPRDMSRVVCSNCQEKGHFKSRCPNPAQTDGGGFDNAGASGGFENTGASGGFESGGFDAGGGASSGW